MKFHYPFLFFVLLSGTLAAQQVNERLLNAYHNTLFLKMSEARSELAKPYSGDRNIAFRNYVSSLSDFIELILDRDPEGYEQYLDREPIYRQSLDKLDQDDPMVIFSSAETRLHSALLRLNYNDQFTGALRMIQLYNLTRKNMPVSAQYNYLNKTTGVIQILLSLVPRKYNFFLSLLQIHPDIAQGISQLRSLSEQQSIFRFEGSMLYALLNAYYLRDPDEAWKTINNTDPVSHHSLLYNYLRGLIAVKTHRNEIAIEAFENCQSYPPSVMQIPQSRYYLADSYLKKLSLDQAERTYRIFLSVKRTGSYTKSTYYKLYLIAVLRGQESRAKALREKVIREGTRSTEDDDYAFLHLQGSETHPELLKARLLFDGGYYNAANRILSELDTADLAIEHKLEYHYRKARILQASGNIVDALEEYNRCVDVTSSTENYLIANAHLQKGFIYRQQENYDNARDEFRKALDYSGHIYNSSIHQEAEAALQEIGKKQ